MKNKLILLFASLSLLISGCGGAPKDSTSSGDIESVESLPSDVTKLSFKSASSYEYLSTLNGKKVQICGYMATSSPVDGSFFFLMNLPYQNCPFCKPNTSELSNTMEIYPKKGETFGYTNQAIKVTGKLMVAEPGTLFTDLFDYEFAFKIVDAEYKIMKESEMPKELALWQKFSSSGLVQDIYDMYDYVYFTCCWPTYFVNSYTDADGNLVPGFYLYSEDALHFIKTDGAQWNYGYKKGYFEDIISRIEKISADGFKTLVENIKKAKALAEYAISELEAGHFTYKKEYVPRFGTEDFIFTMDDTQLESKWETIYYEFTDWLGSFEM